MAFPPPCESWHAVVVHEHILLLETISIEFYKLTLLKLLQLYILPPKIAAITFFTWLLMHEPGEGGGCTYHLTVCIVSISIPGV